MVSVGEQDGHFGIEPLVDGASHELDVFVVLSFEYFALVVYFDEEFFALENVLVGCFFWYGGEVDVACGFFEQIFGCFFYFFGADGGEWVVAHLIIIGSGSNYYNAMLLTANAV